MSAAINKAPPPPINLQADPAEIQRQIVAAIDAGKIKPGENGQISRAAVLDYALGKTPGSSSYTRTELNKDGPNGNLIKALARLEARATDAKPFNITTADISTYKSQLAQK